MTTPAQRRRRIGWGVGLAFAGAVVGMVLGWLVAIQLEGERDAAKIDEAQAKAKAGAAQDSLEALCSAGYQSACDAAASIGEVDDPERQDYEIQEPEYQEREIQEPEHPDGERQDAEEQESEVQDGEIQDDEIDDLDPDDPEKQDEEIQDEEIDDPDPNSALQFAIRDDCNPGPGEVVVDVDGSFERGDGVLTFVLTCQTAAGNPTGGNQ